MNVIQSNSYDAENAFAPLVNLIGEEYAAQYMYMGSYNTRNMTSNVRIQAYKHALTRSYIYIDNSGHFYKRAVSCANSFYEVGKATGLAQIITDAIKDAQL